MFASASSSSRSLAARSIRRRMTTSRPAITAETRTIIQTVDNHQKKQPKQQERYRTFSSTATATETEPTPTPPPSTVNPPASSRQRLLRAALAQVPKHGWTAEALAAAVPAGASLSWASQLTPSDLVAHVMDDWNQQLRHELAETEQHSNRDMEPKQRLAFALQRRLEYQTDLVQSQKWHEAMAVGLTLQPWHTSQQLKELMDIVVSYAYHPNNNNANSQESTPSETAVLALGAVYVATELHMLADTSAQYQATWQFLHQRLDEWEQGGNLAAGLLPSPTMIMSPSTQVLVGTLGEALASGLQSVLMSSSSSTASTSTSSTLANQNLVNQVSQAASHLASTIAINSNSTTSTDNIDGTHPSHYETTTTTTTASTTANSNPKTAKVSATTTEPKQ